MDTLKLDRRSFLRHAAEVVGGATQAGQWSAAASESYGGEQRTERYSYRGTMKGRDVNRSKSSLRSSSATRIPIGLVLGRDPKRSFEGQARSYDLESVDARFALQDGYSWHRLPPK